MIQSVFNGHNKWNRYSSTIPALAMLVLLSVVGLGAGSMFSIDLAQWSRPRVGTSWILLIFPLLYLIKGVVKNGSESYFMAALMCFLFAAYNTMNLCNVGTVAVVTNYLDDQLQAAWYWQVGALIASGLMLFGHATFIAGDKRFQVQPNPILSRNFRDSTWFSSWERIRKSPYVVQLFILYGTCSTAIELVLLILDSNQPRSSTVASFVYVAPLCIIYSLFLRGPKMKGRRILFLVSMILAALGTQLLAVWLLQRELGTSQVATRIRIIAPFFWAAMFWSPVMLRFVETDKNVEYQPAQVSIGDLVFLTSVAAIAIAVSLAPFWGR